MDPLEIEHVHEERDYTSNGQRLVRRHPNSYPMDPNTRDLIRHANAAAYRLDPWTDHDGALPIEALEDVVLAYEHLHDLYREVPNVISWVCGYSWGTEYLGRRPFSDFSAHRTREEAERWLPFWRNQYPDNEWVVVERPAGVILFREENLTDDELHTATRRSS